MGVRFGEVRQFRIRFGIGKVRPRLVNEIHELALRPSMTVSTAGSSTSDGPDHRTKKFAPGPPVVSVSLTTNSTLASAASSAGCGR